jgi:hypothetical protein
VVRIDIFPRFPFSARVVASVFSHAGLAAALKG